MLAAVENGGLRLDNRENHMHKAEWKRFHSGKGIAEWDACCHIKKSKKISFGLSMLSVGPFCLRGTTRCLRRENMTFLCGRHVLCFFVFGHRSVLNLKIIADCVSKVWYHLILLRRCFLYFLTFYIFVLLINKMSSFIYKVRICWWFCVRESG